MTDVRLRKSTFSLIANWVHRRILYSHRYIDTTSERISISKERPCSIMRLHLQLRWMRICTSYTVIGAENLFFDDKQLWVVDWEPSLSDKICSINLWLQNLMSLMKDRQNNELIRRTDDSFFIGLESYIRKNNS